MSLLAQIAIFLAAAVVAIPIFTRFNLGSVLGYLTAGIIIGPASLGLISSVDTTQNIAQFGIVLLMFVIGLELQPSRLWVLRKPIFVQGFVQVAVTTACLGAGAYFIFAQSCGLGVRRTPFSVKVFGGVAGTAACWGAGFFFFFAKSKKAALVVGFA